MFVGENFLQYADIVVPGAFAKSLRQHGLPLLLWQHKQDDPPVGTIIEAKEDKKGLWIRADLPKDDDFVRGRLVPQLKRRGTRGLSIGFKVIDSGRRKSDNVRHLKELRLIEISFVNLPMNPEAGMESIKGQSDDDVEEFLATARQFAKELNGLTDKEQHEQHKNASPEMDYLLATMRLFVWEVDQLSRREE